MKGVTDGRYLVDREDHYLRWVTGETRKPDRVRRGMGLYTTISRSFGIKEVYKTLLLCVVVTKIQVRLLNGTLVWLDLTVETIKTRLDLQRMNN